MKSNRILAAIILFALGLGDAFGTPLASFKLKIKVAITTSEITTLTQPIFIYPDRPLQKYIPVPKESITVGDIKFRIVRATFCKTAMGFIPPNMSEDHHVMFVEIEPLSGFKRNLKELDISVTCGSGQKMKAILIVSGSIIQILSDVMVKGSLSEYHPEDNNIAWAFVVSKGRNRFFLNLPTGEVINLKSYIK